MQLTKIWLTLILALSLTLYPAFGSPARAGSFTFEGISTMTVEDEYAVKQHRRGLVLNFSFGGPHKYKQDRKLQEEIRTADLGSGKMEAFGVLAIAIAITAITLSAD